VPAGVGAEVGAGVDAAVGPGVLAGLGTGVGVGVSANVGAGGWHAIENVIIHNNTFKKPSPMTIRGS
jgi:hypothetical protein